MKYLRLVSFKNIKTTIIFVLLSIFLILMAIFYEGSSENESGLMFLIIPFIFIGNLLRHLSLYNGIYNIFAIIIYCLLSLLPICYIILKVIKKKIVWYQIICLIALSTSLFFILYYFINPHLLIELFSKPLLDNDTFLEQSLFILQFGIASVFYSIIFICFGITLLFSKIAIEKSIVVLINLGILLLLINVFYMKLSDLLYIGKTSNNNIQIWYEIINYLYIVAYQTFLVLILIHSKKFLLYAQSKELRYEVVSESKITIKYSKILISILLLGNFIFIIVQILLRKELQNINFQLSFPFIELVCTIALYILSSFFLRSYEISEENKLVI